MQEYEVVITALLVFVPQFRTLPRVYDCDNICTLLRSISVRCPRINEHCTVMCDRFHYNGRTCNSILDSICVQIFTSHATLGAKSLKYVWNTFDFSPKVLSPV